MECLLRTIMETTKKLQQRVLILILMECLLSTFDVQGWCSGNVLILILMECLLRVLFFSLFLVYWRLNPYSNGMLTQDEADPKKFKDIDSLNPYSNGMLTQFIQMMYLVNVIGLNPYSNGMLTQSLICAVYVLGGCSLNPYSNGMLTQLLDQVIFKE